MQTINQFKNEVENIRAMERMERQHQVAANRADLIGAIAATLALATVAVLIVYGFSNFIS